MDEIEKTDDKKLISGAPLGMSGVFFKGPLGFIGKSFKEEEYFRSRIVIWLILSSLLFNLANWAILWIFIKPVDFPIILHYNVYFGVDGIGDWKEVFLNPAVGVFLFLINFALSLFFYRKKERIASYLLLMAALMIQLGLAVASIAIAIINY